MSVTRPAGRMGTADCMGPTVLFRVVLFLFIIFVPEAVGGDYCHVTTQTTPITRYCEVGGCCIPDNSDAVTGDTDLCCFSLIAVILVTVFVGLPVCIFFVVCLVICIKRCVKKHNQTSLTPLHQTCSNGQTQHRPKPLDRNQNHDHGGSSHPVRSSPRLREPRPSLVLPGAISQSYTSQHELPIPSASPDYTDQSQFPLSPPPPYASRASRVPYMSPDAMPDSSGYISYMARPSSIRNISPASSRCSNSFAQPIATPDLRGSTSPSDKSNPHYNSRATAFPDRPMSALSTTTIHPPTQLDIPDNDLAFI